jgi:ribosomal protein S18 acetylase RimI-like enzyme
VSHSSVYGLAGVTDGHDALRRLDWDSRHFELPVAQIVSADLSDAALASVLCHARDDGVQLVYWLTGVDRHVPSSLLGEFTGLLVDWKTTFMLDIAGEPAALPSHVGLDFSEWPPSPATPELLALGVSCGIHSRFHADPHLDKDKVDDLFRIWTEKSAHGDLAAATIVATPSGSDKPVGLVAISRGENTGRIVLLGVGEGCRSLGVGTLLLDAAHRWMAGRGLGTAVVVTQRRNAAARRLYQKAGYRQHSVERVYHFWPMRKPLDRPV